MHATELIIGEHAYRLPPDADEQALLSELTQAIRAGGGVVELPATSSQSVMAVLVSPGVPVFIERIKIPAHSDGDLDSGGEDPRPSATGSSCDRLPVLRGGGGAVGAERRRSTLGPWGGSYTTAVETRSTSRTARWLTCDWP